MDNITETAVAIPDYGIGKDVKPENIFRREQSLIAHGTQPLEARRLAVEAENNQVARDGQTAEEREKAEEDARKSIGAGLKKMTLEQLIAFAAKKKIEIPADTTLKPDVLAFLLDATAA